MLILSQPRWRVSHTLLLPSPGEVVPGCGRGNEQSQVLSSLPLSPQRPAFSLLLVLSLRPLPRPQVLVILPQTDLCVSLFPSSPAPSWPGLLSPSGCPSPLVSSHYSGLLCSSLSFTKDSDCCCAPLHPPFQPPPVGPKGDSSEVLHVLAGPRVIVFGCRCPPPTGLWQGRQSLLQPWLSLHRPSRPPVPLEILFHLLLFISQSPVLFYPSTNPQF